MNKPLFIITHAVPYHSQDGRLVKLLKRRAYGRRTVDGDGTAFRLYDGDGELLFRGRLWDDGSEEEAFAPLDWAQADSGATRLDLYERRPNGVYQWGTL